MNLGHLVESELGYVFYFYHCVELVVQDFFGASFIFSFKPTSVRSTYGIQYLKTTASVIMHCLPFFLVCGYLN